MGREPLAWSEIVELGRGFMPARIVLTAVELDLFTVLEQRGPLGPVELGRALGASERGTVALAEALVALGLLERTAQGAFAATEPARRTLSRHSPHWRAAPLLHLGALWRSWSELTEVVRTGRPPAREPERKEQLAFQLAMHHLKLDRAEAIARALPLGGSKRVLDLGGGAGTIAAALLRLDPAVEVTLYDLHLALDVAKKLWPREWIEAGRLRLKAGDMLQDLLPAGFDLVLLSDVIHMFEPVEVRRLFARVRDSVVGGGLIAVRDFFLDEDRSGPVAAAVFAVNMLVATPAGRVYTRGEVGQWLEQAGFTAPEERAAEGDAEHRILLARKPAA
ncbi:MAG: hypothetical protein KatS3mg102_2227 [Planctomycetota bacterium]|nr:MAG: hypothetical protein KatS3mg102_2227 [Planctomycetota bacterium]